MDDKNHYKSATQYACEAIDSLSSGYRQWCDSQNLPQWSADELIMEERITDEQRKYLKLFIEAWEAAESAACLSRVLSDKWEK